MLKRILTLLVLAILFSQYTNAQVTTSSISGTAKAANGEALVGATVVATHEPTGTVYRTISRTGGRFDIQNVTPGGPYTITLTYVGYTEFSRKDITIPLGERFDMVAELTAANQQLSEVVVSGTRSGATVKTGAATNISNRMVRTIPNVSRSITGLTRLTPQANGNSFAGMNDRYNNITIDGSVFNNNFGRSGDGLVPGGGRSISLDAIDQIQVNISPFDVRQAGFIGGGINAVTRRGTNNFYATVYTFQRPESFYGKKVKDQTVDTKNLSSKTYGASVGGAIIKNKLFYFVNAEKENTTRPGQIWLANSPETASSPLVTPVLKTDLDKLSEFLNSQYSYETGPYQGYNFGIDNYKVLGRVDWNITQKHRLTVRYTQSKTEDDEMVNTSSRPTGASSFGNGRRGGKTGGLAYANTNFKNSTEVKSGVAELNSTINNKFSNQLLASYTDNRPTRVTPNTVPFVDIMNGSNVYISFGTDLFSYKNYIVDKAFNAAENLTINLGKHTVTVGGSFDHMEFQNSFTSGSGGGYYRYASLQDFLDKKAPVYFAVSYDPSNPKGIAVPSAKFNQLGVYAQDVWAASNKFKLTYGLRLDKPTYPYTPPKNPALQAVTFKDENGNPENFDVSQFPEAKVLVSPRVGFTYDVAGDRSTIVRGGTGIFTGRIPFIWLVNQVGDNGVIRAQYQASATDLVNIRYNTDRTTYIPTNPPAVGTTIPSGSSYSAVAKDFKMPQVWRSNLAFERKVSSNILASVEAIYTKMVHNAYFRNDNLGAQAGTLGGVADKRPIYNKALNSAVATMAVLDNINKGMSFSFTPMIQKTFSKGWEASLAYTYTFAQEVAIGSSDQSASGWTTNNIIMNPNKPELSYSNFSIPHRIVAYGTYRFSYMNDKLATTIGMYYSAASQERFHFRYSGDINGDGQSNDIIYIPKDPSEIAFASLTAGGVTYTPQQQSDAFFAFINNDKYLSKHKGQYMDRYGATLPWVQSLDLKVLEDFYVTSGAKKHNIQVSLDVTNLLNLLNKNWGYRFSYTYGTFQDQGLLGVPSGFDKANPKYTFNPTGATKAYQPNYSTSSTWGLNLGIRYLFN